MSNHTILVTIQSFSETMRINGSAEQFLILLFMFPITLQSIASDDYESNSEKDEVTIELNVNININGSKTKEIAPGKLLFGI